jgi:toxin-antitoxin system PIN domain toxin
MRALLDVNVLIALLDADHSLHLRASQWFGSHARAGWASCPITQNGCIRIMSHPGYPNAVAVRAVMERLAEACADPFHGFWPDDISLLAPRVVDMERIHGPRQLTDLYLLALAVRHGGQFVTFDGSVSLDPITGAGKKHLVCL